MKPRALVHFPAAAAFCAKLYCAATTMHVASESGMVISGGMTVIIFIFGRPCEWT